MHQIHEIYYQKLPLMLKISGRTGERKVHIIVKHYFARFAQYHKLGCTLIYFILYLNVVISIF